MRIITVHGIRRDDRWYKRFARLKPIVSKGIKVINHEYGYFNIYSFLNPWMRSQAVQDFVTFYNDEVFDDERPSAVCHSFGSYIIYQAMLQQKTIIIDKLVICGSILREDIDWKVLFDRGQILEIYHDYGQKDEVVKFSSFIKCCGKGGQKGFTIPDELKDKITQEVN